MIRLSWTHLVLLLSAVIVAVPSSMVTADTEARRPHAVTSLVQTESDVVCAVVLAPSSRDTTGRNDDLEIAEKDECPG